MAHEILGQMFYSRETHGWHRIGTVVGVDEQLTAVGAWQKMGPFGVELRPVYICTADGEYVELAGSRSIVRDAIPDDPQVRSFGVVGDDYHLITPDQFVEMWDQHVALPVETIGVLSLGSTLFVTAPLPMFEVKGYRQEGIQPWLSAVSPMTGNDAAEVFVSLTRIVCQNTLRMGQQTASQMHKIRHDRHALERMGQWLAWIGETAQMQVDVIREATEILAGAKADRQAVVDVMDAAYPMPLAPDTYGPPAIVQAREHRYETEKIRVSSLRECALSLYHGDGMGMDSPAAAGTLWGVTQAVVETEDYRKGRAAVKDALFGGRAQAKARAFDAALGVAGFQVIRNPKLNLPEIVKL